MALFSTALSSAAAWGQADSDHGLAYGKGIYSVKANCASCHGWAGDGEGDPHAHGIAANLRNSSLTREQIIEVIGCGRPGTDMPHFDAFAYGDEPCYGLKGNDVPGKPPLPLHSLQPKEIAAVADYLFAKVIGKGPPTRSQCVEYFGAAIAVCGDLP